MGVGRQAETAGGHRGTPALLPRPDTPKATAPGREAREGARPQPLAARVCSPPTGGPVLQTAQLGRAEQEHRAPGTLCEARPGREARILHRRRGDSALLTAGLGTAPAHGEAPRLPHGWRPGRPARGQGDKPKTQKGCSCATHVTV